LRVIFRVPCAQSRSGIGCRAAPRWSAMSKGPRNQAEQLLGPSGISWGGYVEGRWRVGSHTARTGGKVTLSARLCLPARKKYARSRTNVTSPKMILVQAGMLLGE